MALKRLKKGESPFDRVAKIETQIKAQRSKLIRCTNRLAALEKQRAYCIAKTVKEGVTA